MAEKTPNCNAEEWRLVVGYESAYEVSNRGKVRQCGSIRSNQSTHRLMKQNQFAKGKYLYVGLCPDGLGNQNSRKCQRKIPVHHLVAAAFLGPRPPGMVINHIDGCPLNNWAENLEYCTQTANSHHAFRTGLTVHNLTSDKVRALRALPATVSHSEAGRMFGVHSSQVSRIRRGLVWKFLD